MGRQPTIYRSRVGKSANFAPVNIYPEIYHLLSNSMFTREALSRYKHCYNNLINIVITSNHCFILGRNQILNMVIKFTFLARNFRFGVKRQFYRPHWWCRYWKLRLFFQDISSRL